MKSAYSIRRPVANLYLVRERDRRRWRELLLVLAVVVPIALGVLSYVWISHQLLSSGYRVRELEEEVGRLRRIERQLQVEAAHLASPERVEAAALELGMTTPTTESVVFLEELE